MSRPLPIAGPAKPHAVPPTADDEYDEGRPPGYATAGGGPTDDLLERLSAIYFLHELVISEVPKTRKKKRRRRS